MKITTTVKFKKCVICGAHFVGFGNNPAPVKFRGRACNECNAMVVIPMRLRIAVVNKRGASLP